MRIISLPDDSESITQLYTALKYANQTWKYEITIAEEGIIQQIYSEYDENKGAINDLFKSNNLSPATNDALEVAYSEVQMNGRLSDLRDSLLNIDEVYWCPYCGLTQSSQLDHYLPASIYKAVSIYSRNLIPICVTCNNKKRTAVQNGANSTFFHAYYEEFPNEAVFITEIEFVHNTITFNYRINEEIIDDVLIGKLKFQIERSDLESRLIKASIDLINSMRNAIQMIYEFDNVNGVREFFLRQYRQELADYGHNYWKTSFMLSFSNCENFCNGGFIEYFDNL